MEGAWHLGVFPQADNSHYIVRTQNGVGAASLDAAVAAFTRGPAIDPARAVQTKRRRATQRNVGPALLLKPDLPHRIDVLTRLLKKLQMKIK